MVDTTATTAELAPNFDFFSSNFSRRPDIRTYRQLDPSLREIRLLRICKQSGELHATLEHANLDDKPIYEALSYCWGPPSTLHAINLDHHIIWISKTLFNFLAALCHHSQELPVWVDQLCINQADSVERSSQVAMMGDIYRSAKGVRAWLGNSDVDIEYTLAYVNAISQQHIQNTPEIRQQAVEGLEQICRRPYWRRMWIVQEIGLANHLTVHCGDHKVDFGDLYKLITELGLAENISTVYDLQQSLGANATESRHTGRFLIQQIVAFQNRVCEDKRDRVYAVRSLAKNGAPIVVDYEKTICEVLWDVLQNGGDPKSAHWDFTSGGNSSFNFEPFPSLMNALQLSVEEVLASASGLRDTMLSSWHEAILERRVRRIKRLTGPERLRIDYLLDPRLELAFRGKTKQYLVSRDGYRRDDRFVYETLQYYVPHAKVWTFHCIGMMPSWTVLVQACHDRFKIVGFKLWDESIDFDRCSYLEPDLRQFTYRQRITLLLLLAGHIQCCPRPSRRVRRSARDQFDDLGNVDLKIHYSLYAVLSLSSTTRVWKPNAEDYINTNFVNIPPDSLCDCDPTDYGWEIARINREFEVVYTTIR